MNAYEWGKKHGSCEEALKFRKNYESQEAWWLACHRGDWLIWQLRKLPSDQLKEVLPKLLSAINKIVDRAVKTYCLKCGVASVEVWAAGWISGKDRSLESAEAAKWAAEAAEVVAVAVALVAAVVAAFDAESKQQANDIREVIPEWIWG